MVPRVALFIDGSNLYNGMKDKHGKTRLKLDTLIEQLVKDRALVRAYYYNVPLTDDYDASLREGQSRFFESLRRIPYVTVRLGRMHLRSDGTHEEKGIDVAIAVESLTLAFGDAYDTAVFVSGDGDYVDLVEAIKARGKHVECATFRSQISGELLDSVDIFRPLDELDWKQILF